MLSTARELVAFAGRDSEVSLDPRLLRCNEGDHRQTTINNLESQLRYNYEFIFILYAELATAILTQSH